MNTIRIFPRVLLLAVPMALGPFATPLAQTQGGCFDLIIEVKNTKANGKAWDTAEGNFAPDIMVSVDGKYGDFTKPRCRDSYTCMMYDVKTDQRVSSVEVWDLDVFAHDPIGAGQCIFSMGACILGQASIIATKCQ